MGIALEVIGWIGVVLITICNIPQVLKIVRTKQARDFSVFGYSLLLAGCFMTTARAIVVVPDPVYLTSNILAFTIVGIMVVMIVRYRRR